MKIKQTCSIDGPDIVMVLTRPDGTEIERRVYKDMARYAVAPGNSTLVVTIPVIAEIDFK